MDSTYLDKSIIIFKVKGIICKEGDSFAVSIKSNTANATGPNNIHVLQLRKVFSYVICSIEVSIVLCITLNSTQE